MNLKGTIYQKSSTTFRGVTNGQFDGSEGNVGEAAKVVEIAGEITPAHERIAGILLNSENK